MGNNTSSATTTSRELVRPAAPAPEQWHFARLLEPLFAGGSAMASIMSLGIAQTGYMTYIATDQQVEVFDYILPCGNSVYSFGSPVVIIAWNAALCQWCLVSPS